jgi:four helix bundle protein
MKHPEEYMIWHKVLELSKAMQKVTEELSSPGSDDLRSTVRKITFTVPSHLAEGFMIKNIKDRKASFYRALNTLEEILKSLVLTEQMGHFKSTHIHEIKNDICELTSMIGELLMPQQRVL